MEHPALPRTQVVNFNAPELHQLALALSRAHALAAYVRPYVDKGRPWERALKSLPGIGPAWNASFGRRTLADASLAALTREAGVLPDLCAAVLHRASQLPIALRHRATSRLHRAVREAVAEAAGRDIAGSRCIVAYEGFALPAFRAAAATPGVLRVLNYPVAHHRRRRAVRLEENEREPGFASTWPDFDDWPPDHEARLDEEIHLADAVLVGSRYAGESFVEAGVDPARMRVVPYGVDLDVFQDSERPAHPGFRAIYAGQLTQRKGLAYLLRGYRRFARAGTRLTLVGSVVGSERPLRAFAGSFEHVLHQTRPALADMYRASDVFVFPTLIEGMPLVVLEAMACGLPVIVTANGPADIVRDGIDGYIVPERDEFAIADRLERLHRDPQMRWAMGRSAAARAREFSWQAYAHRALGVLAALADPGLRAVA